MKNTILSYVMIISHLIKKVLNSYLVIYCLKSIIIKINIGFNKCNDIFADTVLTAAIVDGFTHKAHILNLNHLD